MGKGLLDFLKNSSKQEMDLQPFQIFRTMRSVFHFTLGIGKSFESVHRNFIVAWYPKSFQGDWEFTGL